MKLPSFSRLVLLGMILVFAAQVQAQTDVITRKGTIRFSRVVGTVEARYGGTANPLDYPSFTVQPNDTRRITEDYTVETLAESSVILIFTNGSTINLRENTVVEIRQFRQNPFEGSFQMSTATAEPSQSQTSLHMTQGELIGNVKTLSYDGGSSFNVSTPAGAAGIRGTTFRIRYIPDGTGLAFTYSMQTLEGTIEVTAEGSVAAPVGVSDSQEFEIVVDIDDETGVVTILTPPEEIAARIAPDADMQEIETIALEVANEVAAQVFVETDLEDLGTEESGEGEETTEEESTEEEDEDETSDDETTDDETTDDETDETTDETDEPEPGEGEGNEGDQPPPNSNEFNNDDPADDTLDDVLDDVDDLTNQAGSGG